MANNANDKTDRLGENANKGEGVENPENFANVINGCLSLTRQKLIS